MTTDQSTIKASTPTMLSMKRVELLDEMQPRSRTSPDAIGRYATLIRTSKAMQTECPLPPILVWKLAGQDNYIVIDGYHRFRAHEQERLRRIKARVIHCESMEEAKWIAAQANRTHGVPLRKKDYREVFRRYIEAGKHKDAEGNFIGYRAVRAGLGGIAAQGTIWNWMKEDYPEIVASSDKPEEDQEEQSGSGQATLSHDMRHMQDYGRGVIRAAGDSFKRFGLRDREAALDILVDVVFDVARAMGDSEEGIIQTLMDRRPSIALAL